MTTVTTPETIGHLEPPPPPCEAILGDGPEDICGKPAAWWCSCPCDKGAFSCDGCRADALRNSDEWMHDTCGRGPRSWRWSPL